MHTLSPRSLRCTSGSLQSQVLHAAARRRLLPTLHTGRWRAPADFTQKRLQKRCNGLPGSHKALTGHTQHPEVHGNLLMHRARTHARSGLSFMLCSCMKFQMHFHVHALSPAPGGTACHVMRAPRAHRATKQTHTACANQMDDRGMRMQ